MNKTTNAEQMLNGVIIITIALLVLLGSPVSNPIHAALIAFTLFIIANIGYWWVRRSPIKDILQPNPPKVCELCEEYLALQNFYSSYSRTRHEVCIYCHDSLIVSVEQTGDESC